MQTCKYTHSVSKTIHRSLNFFDPIFSVPDFIDLIIEKKHSEHLYIPPQKDRELGMSQDEH